MNGDEQSRMPWKVVRRKRVFAAGPIREVAVEHVSLPDGSQIEDYYHIRLDDFALVFATTSSGVLVLRQYKHGPRRTCLTFPGGSVQEGETPLEAGQRELLEETGYAASTWSHLGSYVTNANQFCNTAHLFRADGCAQRSLPVAPDVERPEILIVPEDRLLQPEFLEQLVIESHVALLTMATHPTLQRHATNKEFSDGSSTR
jgi:ADP-ribose pyrophosphatase